MIEFSLPIQWMTVREAVTEERTAPPGSPAAVSTNLRRGRPEALRPTLSDGLPFTGVFSLEL